MEIYGYRKRITSTYMGLREEERDFFCKLFVHFFILNIFLNLQFTQNAIFHKNVTVFVPIVFVRDLDIKNDDPAIKIKIIIY